MEASSYLPLRIPTFLIQQHISHCLKESCHPYIKTKHSQQLLQYAQTEGLSQMTCLQLLKQFVTDKLGNLSIQAILHGQHCEFKSSWSQVFGFESVTNLILPEPFSHDKAFMNFISDDRITSLMVLVLLMERQQSEPVARLVVETSQILLLNYSGSLNDCGSCLLFNHWLTLINFTIVNKQINTLSLDLFDSEFDGYFDIYKQAIKIYQIVQKLSENFIIQGLLSQHMQIDLKVNDSRTKQVDPEDLEDCVFDPVPAMELVFEAILVNAFVPQDVEIDGKKKEVKAFKQILKPCTGRFSPNTFTAILGPSGCGKTTMLNLISGRQMSTNLELIGNLRINGQSINSVAQYKSYIGYVMQEDYMLPTFTPYEAFKFVTDLRLPNLSEQEKESRVNQIIRNLGLQKCKNTWIGDTRIRGVSGGEKKRTSIGLELLINPSIIFLDEPTTGLDSTTSLNLIRFLNRLAKQGRTVISTIHQPSSQIFMQFDHIMLMVQGHIIYDGQAQRSMDYFSKIGYPVPMHTNPTDHYMKLMNKQGLMLTKIEKKINFTDEGIKEEFDKIVEHLVSNFVNNRVAIQGEQKPFLDTKIEVDNKIQAGWCTQFSTVFKRNGINTFRQPMDFILKVVQAIFFGVICIVLYYEKGTTFEEIFQNNQGCIFFLVMNTGFSYVFASVNLFNFQRPVFIRERLSNTYSTSAYYFGRTVAVLPIQILTVFLFLVIAYFPCNLDNSASVFFKSLLSLELCAFMSSSFGLFLSTVFSDAGVVMALVPVLIIPFLLVGGFFVPLETVPKVYYPFEYLSMFRYGFQGMIYSQYENNPLYFNGQPNNLIGSRYNFETSFILVLILMAAIGVAIRGLALFIMYMISNPKILPLKRSSESETLNMRPFDQKQIQNSPGGQAAK